MMLRNRSRKISSKQALMSDQNTVNPQNQTNPISSFLGSPRFLSGFLNKSVSDSHSLISPSSILDSKHISNANPFVYDKKSSKPINTFSGNKHTSEKPDSKAIGLALIDEKVSEDSTKQNKRMILLKSKLKVQIPILSQPSISSPKSPADFGIKTRNSQFLSNSSTFGSANSSVQTNFVPPVSTEVLSLTEIEHSEDYTRVISHGPNPRTTHIYDNCIVKSCKKHRNRESPSKIFLSFCHTCKRNLGPGTDIYMYRGESAFCSEECRDEKIMMDGSNN